MIHLPDALYIYLSAVHPDAWQVIVAVALEQLGYGVGFTAYMLYLIYILFCWGRIHQLLYIK